MLEPALRQTPSYSLRFCLGLGQRKLAPYSPVCASAGHYTRPSAYPARTPDLSAARLAPARAATSMPMRPQPASSILVLTVPGSSVLASWEPGAERRAHGDKWAVA